MLDLAISVSYTHLDVYKRQTLYVTHDQEEALTLSDRIAVFNNGFVEQVDKPYNIYNHSGSEFVCDFIGEINRLNAAVLSLSLIHI